MQYYQKNPSYVIILLGNSTAKITSQHGLFYNYLAESQGKEKAKQYLEANEEAVRNIERIIKQEQIECEFKKQDAYVFTNQETELPKIKKEVKIVQSLGFPAEFVTEIELPLAILGAIKFPNQAQFNPCKYSNGLVKAMLEKNVRIFENTKVVDLKNKNELYEVITENGSSVTAKYVVLSSHYPIINTPGYYFLKMYQSSSYVVAVETQKTLFQGMYINSEKPTFSFRTAGDEQSNLLLVAGMDHKTGEKKDLSNNYNELLKMAKQIDPACKLKYQWCTQDCISLDKIPYIGRFSSLMPNVYIGTGYKKWGITNSNVAANIIVDKILEKENPYEDVFTSTRLEAIKNHQEVGNLLKEVAKSLVIEKLKIPDETLKEITNGDGKIVELNGKKVGIYKDETGQLFAVKPVCSHLGCELSWNNSEKTWDCPCHGSRFSYMGKSIYDPSINNLERIDIE